MALTPTQLSLRYLRNLNYTVAIVEHWNPFARIRQDLFGFADLLAFNATEVVLVQTTSKSNMAARSKKIADNPLASAWVGLGRRIEIHGWAKVKNRWVVTVK